MKNVPIEDVVAGQVLAVDVANTGGQVLCKKGVTLSDAHVQAIKRAGIKSISIQNQRMDIESFPKDIVEKAQIEIDWRFKHNPQSHPLVKEIKQRALLKMVQNMVDSGS
jgi:hypothetical protein